MLLEKFNLWKHVRSYSYESFKYLMWVYMAVFSFETSLFLVGLSSPHTFYSASWLLDSLCAVESVYDTAFVADMRASEATELGVVYVLTFKRGKNCTLGWELKTPPASQVATWPRVPFRAVQSSVNLKDKGTAGEDDIYGSY